MPKIYNKCHDKIPKDAKYVGRPTRFGNKFVFGEKSKLPYVVHVATREEAVSRYREWLEAQIKDGFDISELRGKDLVCWCDAEKEACHASVLMEFANRKVRA